MKETMNCPVARATGKAGRPQSSRTPKLRQKNHLVSVAKVAKKTAMFVMLAQSIAANQAAILLICMKCY